MRTCMKMVLISTAIVLLAIAGPVLARQEEPNTPPVNFAENITNTGTSAAAFLNIGVGARAQSMGNASIAVNTDATALFWNPAAVAQLERFSLAVDHTRWLADTQLDFVGLVFPIPGVGAFGVSLLSMQSVDAQPVRTILQPEGTGEFYDASDLAMAATISLALTDRFSLGLTGKYIRESLWHEAASTFAADLGVVYQTRLRGLRLATSLTNFGSDMRLEGRDLLRPFDDDPLNYSNDRLNVNLKTDAFSLPIHFRFGVGYTALDTRAALLTFAVDLLDPSDASESVNLGVEYVAWNSLSLRGGYRSLFERDRTGGAAFGVGLTRPLVGNLQFTLDYSYADWGLLENTQRLSIILSN